jgi:hypothetical protein
MDLFNPTNDPQDLAVSRAITCAVEAFVVQDFEYADHCFEMAFEFVHAPHIYFAPKGDNATINT